MLRDLLDKGKTKAEAEDMMDEAKKRARMMRFEGGSAHPQFREMEQTERSTDVIVGTCTVVEKQYLRLTVVRLFVALLFVPRVRKRRFVLDGDTPLFSSGPPSGHYQTSPGAAKGSQNGAPTVG